jgi:2-methylcitrate dehydratase
MIQLAAANKPRLDVASGFDPGTIASIEAEVPQITCDFTGGGQYGSETRVRTKEQADHDLRYLLSVALLDGNVMPAQFAADRITRPDVQALMTKVSGRSVC